MKKFIKLHWVKEELGLDPDIYQQPVTVIWIDVDDVVAIVDWPSGPNGAHSAIKHKTLDTKMMCQETPEIIMEMMGVARAWNQT